MQHIVILCRGLGTAGSVALVALRHARELSRSFRVTLVSESAAETDLAQSVVRVPDLHHLRRFRHALDEVLFARSARRRLFEIHQREPIDFVLCEGHVPALLAAKVFRRTTSVKFGVVVHGDVAERGAGAFDRRLTALYDWATPRAHAAADLVVTFNDFFAELAASRGARRGTVAIIPNGVDVADLGMQEPVAPVTRSDGPLRLIFAGRLSVEKGVDVLLDAVERVGNVTLTVAGGGPLEASLRARASDRIRFAGAIPRCELGALYRQHHLACLPSLSDTFPLSALEALACGVPLVVSSAVRGIVEEGVNGLQVPAGDVTALTSAIARVERDRDLHATLSANAHDSVLPRLSWPVVGEQLARRIQSLL